MPIILTSLRDSFMNFSKRSEVFSFTKQVAVPSVQEKYSLETTSPSKTKVTSFVESRQAHSTVVAPCSTPAMLMRCSESANDTLGMPSACPKSFVTKGLSSLVA